MWKNRLGYGLMMTALAVMIYFFGKTFLICAFIGMMVMPVLLKILQRRRKIPWYLERQKQSQDSGSSVDDG